VDSTKGTTLCERQSVPPPTPTLSTALPVHVPMETYLGLERTASSKWRTHRRGYWWDSRPSSMVEREVCLFVCLRISGCMMCISQSIDMLLCENRELRKDTNEVVGRRQY
jgi:alkylhydroperoxidase family enzyme